jgi:collagen type VII alpha
VLGNYSPETSYGVGDAVSFGGSTYVSVVVDNHGNTPGLAPDYWAVLAAQGPVGATGAAGSQGIAGAAGVDGAVGAPGAQGPPVGFAGGWLVSRSYVVGDAVSYGGGSYIAVVANLGREPDVSPVYWGVLAAGGAAGPSGLQGAAGLQGPTGLPGAVGPAGPVGANGAVGPVGPNGAQGAQGGAGAEGPTGAAGPQGVVFRGPYVAGTSFAAGDAVSFGGSSYISLVAGNVGQTPGLSPGSWGLLAVAGSPGLNGADGAVGLAGPVGAQGPVGPIGLAGPPGLNGAVGVNFRGAWVAGTNYSVSDAVTFAGSTYLAESASVNAQPGVASQSWTVLAAAGDSGTSVIGATGAQGPVGPSGATGAPGSVGPQGPAGLNYLGSYASATN